MLKQIINPSFFEGCEKRVTLPLSFSKEMIKVWECFEICICLSFTFDNAYIPLCLFSVILGQLWGGSQIQSIFCVHDIYISALSCDNPMAAQHRGLWSGTGFGRDALLASPCSKYSTATWDISSVVIYYRWSLLKSKESLIIISETLWELYKQWGQSTSWDL